IVAGGGIALKSIAEKMMIPENNLSKGEMVLYQSLSSPFNQILKNAGVKLDMDSLILLLDSYPFGFDVRKEEVVDMIQEGIVDPKKVTRIALRSASSIASLILTTESTVVEEK
ncbi:MAG: chaperonin GroEL, partial [Gelidibacter sp.]|nr:chaperonin GroEL [Gelidibacter sp.]